MPRDLFGDVTRPSISIGNRKWYTVPVSLLSHSLIIAMFVVLPILAAPYMPGVMTDAIPDYITIIEPPTPPPIKPKQPDLAPPPNPNLAPTVAPTGITDEPERIPDLPVVDTPGLIGAGNIENVLPPPPVVVPPPPVKQPPIRVGHMVKTPVKTKNVHPVYPRMALEAQIEGVVIIEATINETGQVINLKPLRSVPLLEQAALDAVRQWEFTPSMLNGVPVPVIMTVTVTFTLAK